MSDDDAVKAYEEIFEKIIPDSIDFFRSKTKDYAGGPAFLLLGSGGQFSDINRKFWKLYQALWLGQTLEGEQPEEIVKDFIGHCWLLLYCLREESQPSVLQDIMKDLGNFGSKLIARVGDSPSDQGESHWDYCAMGNGHTGECLDINGRAHYKLERKS